jgi:hypothetical protein
MGIALTLAPNDCGATLSRSPFSVMRAGSRKRKTIRDAAAGYPGIPGIGARTAA